MKQDFKVGMLVGLGVLFVVAVGWVLLRGRPGPETASGRVSAPASTSSLRPQEPNRPLAGLAPVGQPSAVSGSIQTAAPVARPDANAAPVQPVAAATTPGPGPSAQQTQSAPVPAVAAETVKPARTHTVREGESLSDIADKYYGSSDKWPKIYRANRSAIKDPDRIQPGMKLTIPE
jgi:nucleoid-associated protein YgaU